MDGWHENKKYGPTWYNLEIETTTGGRTFWQGRGTFASPKKAATEASTLYAGQRARIFPVPQVVWTNWKP